MRHSALTLVDFPRARPLARFEGGAIYTAEKQGKFYLIKDESTLAGFLSEEDLRELGGSLVRVLEFDTAAERNNYSRERGWAGMDEDHGGPQDD